MGASRAAVDAGIVPNELQVVSARPQQGKGWGEGSLRVKFG